MLENVFILEDGRKLSYAFYGPEDGMPVLYFHGTPSSRLEPGLLKHFHVDLDQLLARGNFRLVAVDRPGMGLSSFHPQGNFISFASDVVSLTRHLGIKKCPVIAWSGGGPYALAIAHQYPEIIPAVYIITGFTRQFNKAIMKQMGLNRWYFYMAKNMPRLLRFAMNLITRSTITRSLPRWLTGLPEVDYRFLQHVDDLRAMAGLTMKEACRMGAGGAVYEARGYYREMGFPLNEIRQPVHYWWGTRDMNVTSLHAEWLEQHLPRAVMHYREGEGHLSLYINCFGEVLAGMMGGNLHSMQGSG